MDESLCDQIKRMTLTADGKGAVFDIPSEHVPSLLKASGGRLARSCSAVGLQALICTAAVARVWSMIIVRLSGCFVLFVFFCGGGVWHCI